MVSSEVTKRQKKSRRFRRLLKLITGRRQTEWTGATRCPKQDGLSQNRESLIDRKRAVFFRFRLPCRPLAECATIARARDHLRSRPRERGDPYAAAVLMKEGVYRPALTGGHGVW